ncbi:hypothetical protein O3W51_33430 [Streptomyces sp. H39-C1]|nr:hypothetical protein [Streptomyces sp. H39-C1]
MSDRPLTGRGSWSDFVAIDGAYDTQSKTYMHETAQDRNGLHLRLRQIQAALRTLEELGADKDQLGPGESERALVQVPRAKNGGRRLYEQFSLMKETGRGNHQTPDTYTVPANHLSDATFTVPADFFLNGWIQVLNPSEIATWLILQARSQWARDTHAEAGVYLYGKARLEEFGLRRDAWEDGCQRLREFGLIRHARSAPLDSTSPDALGLMDWWVRLGRERYEPYRWQVTNQGLARDAVKVCLRELTIRQKGLATTARLRTPEKGEPSSASGV